MEQPPEGEEEWSGALAGMALAEEAEEEAGEGQQKSRASQQRRPRPNDKVRRKKKTPEEAARAAQAKVAAQQLGAARLEKAALDDKKPEDEGWKDVYWSFLHNVGQGQGSAAGAQADAAAAAGKAELDEDEVDAERSWALVSGLDPARAQAVSQREAATPTLPSDHRQQFVEGSQANWDRFYQNNTVNFFKDRHYLHHQFPELLPSDEERTFLEYGCGVGNTILPLMKTHPRARFYATDFSPTAIRLLQTHPEFEAGRCTAFVSDLTKEDLPTSIPSESVDFILLVFVMSALAPEQMVDVLAKLHRVLKPGGAILFRDYGEYDMAQLRFLSRKNPNKIDECMYVRWDGTTSYFFSLEELRELFGKAGFIEDENKFDIRELKNRKRKIVMFRVWANSRFRKPLAGDLPAACPPTGSVSSSEQETA